MGRFDPIIRRVFVAASVVWAATILLTPALIDAGSRAASALAFGIYTGCSAICHQRPERSFRLFGHQMPVCARCTGIYVGAALAGIAVGVSSIRARRWPAVSVALASTVPSLLTLIYEWTTGDMPSNGLRAAAGLPMGAVASWLVLRASQVE